LTEMGHGSGIAVRWLREEKCRGFRTDRAEIRESDTAYGATWENIHSQNARLSLASC